MLKMYIFSLFETKIVYNIEHIKGVEQISSET